MASVNEPLRLGVIGANSNIARARIYPAVSQSEDLEIVAAASNSEVPSQLAAVHRESYEAVIADPTVEAVYIPLPNSLHREWTERAARAGKHVLCEKPLATDVGDAAAMFAACRNAGVVLAEAFVTPNQPRYQAVIAAASDGEIGEIRNIRSEFSFSIAADRPNDFRRSHRLGGGALWDLGIYALTPVMDLLDNPTVAHVCAIHAGGEVDATTTVTLCDDRAVASVVCSFELPDCQLLEISGTLGSIVLSSPFIGGIDDAHITIHRRDQETEYRQVRSVNPYLVTLEAFAAACRGRALWPRSEGSTLGMIGRIAEILTMTEIPPPPDASPL